MGLVLAMVSCDSMRSRSFIHIRLVAQCSREAELVAGDVLLRFNEARPIQFTQLQMRLLEATVCTSIR